MIKEPGSDFGSEARGQAQGGCRGGGGLQMTKIKAKLRHLTFVTKNQVFKLIEMIEIDVEHRMEMPYQTNVLIMRMMVMTRL